MSRKGRIATKAPDSRLAGRSPEELMEELEGILAKYHIFEVPSYLVLLEGITDVAYLQRAAELSIEERSDDPLQIPPGLATSDHDRITICTPGTPGGDPLRGGTTQMRRLGKELQPFVFLLKVFSGILFVFDHDAAGRQVGTDLSDHGYVEGRNFLTLDPRHHPDALATKDVVIEDLLSADIQSRFFAKGDAWCDQVYEAGEVVRYKWAYQSKPPLCEFVGETAAYSDLTEIHRLLTRIRTVFGFL